jgi:hypothetical protein
MKAVAIIGALAAASAVAAWGADYAAERATAPPALPEPAANDATRELKWDNGVWRTYVMFVGAPGTRFANDFDVSTLPAFTYLRTLRLHMKPGPPERPGARLGVYAWAGGVPGTLVWGPKDVEASVEGWNDFAVTWSLPKGAYKFLAAVEQIYAHPGSASFGVDTNSTFVGHSWLYYRGSWGPLQVQGTYYNLMLRVVVDDEHGPAVTPASVGRVKALYY